MVHPNAFSPPPDICDCGEDELCNLHAAAPQLLEALERVTTLAESLWRKSPEPNPAFYELATNQLARAAIEAAKS